MVYLLLFGWAFTRTLTHRLRGLMLITAPLDSLSCDRTGRLLLKANILDFLHPNPFTSPGSCFYAVVLMLQLFFGQGGTGIYS